MKKALLTLFFIFHLGFVFSQNQTGISGRVLDSKTQMPLASVVVTVQNTTLMQLTTANGEFIFQSVPAGEQLLFIKSQGFKDALFPVTIVENETTNLGDVFLDDDQITDLQVSVIRLFENDLTDDNSGSESTSGLLQSSKDAFQQAAAFNWGQARFRIRGLDSENATTMINGVTMNKRYDGRPQWNNWGGLNDATRNQEFSIGTAPSDYSFGGILGTQEINTRASIYRPGLRVTFSGTNSNYSWRTMGTYASGMGSSGWAFVVSAGKRLAQEGYFEGTPYDANSFFMSVEKKLSDKHSLNFSGFYTPNSRGKNSPNTAEVTQLTSEKYNSYWGYQEGKIRNARTKTIEEPILMLNHYFKINDHSNLNTSLMYQFGKIGNTNIDYQNANSPDPTYFRNLPSYYTSLYAPDQGEFSGAFTPDFDNAEKSKATFLTQPQINWEAMYRANQMPILGNNGTITGYEPAQSHYVLYEDRTDDKTITATTNFSSQLSENLILNAGASFSNLKSHNYQKLLDLLGGTYFQDIDAFYKGNQAQSDLNNPNRQVVVGDLYGYNYKYEANTLEAFTQFKFNYEKADFYLAQSFSSTNYQREGLYKNGIYETISFGKSEKVQFENFGFKGGLTYKISGKQMITFNAAHLTKAPTIRNTFPNARLNNSIVDGLQSENINSLDASYLFRTPKVKARITGFYTTIKDATSTSFFYAEGIFDNGAGYNNTNAFVSQTLSHLNKKNIGAEFSFEYQVTATIKTSLSAGYGRYTFDSNPNVSINNDAVATVENAKPTFDFGTALLKNYKQAGTPQQAIALGLEYRDPKYWWIGTNINYLAETYIDVSPITRTNRFYINPTSGFPFPEATEERAAVLLKQEKLDPLLLLNFTGGKSWRIKGKYLGLFVSVNNALDIKYKTGGYEQARNGNYRQINQDVSSGTPSFGNKYFYGYGRTYFVNLSLNL
ncbi:TonB-dependent receptor [Flavobacterium muglaense]|uniref:Carboxypeptidase-like regulatory domain-containing protein n=1 Tax=Flavobacterium muglaense TaxID=2764716 RepID=A0A923N0D3_9FLAO|nr:TonB-dependent receptor [Flavobacterium muglaense]MBC5838522.1 carboxypeptidase-like regulatory domain-containing protein [Flavobacterium muglaense]MBC5845056.1 carboxypeptidase-like regulatory domain-containing protein [Flavobacterium muglaense]